MSVRPTGRLPNPLTNPLIQMRKCLDLSQAQVASQLDISQQYVDRYENGCAASLSHIIANYYDMMVPGTIRRELSNEMFADLRSYGLPEHRLSKFYGFTMDMVKNSSDAYFASADLYRLWVRLDRAYLGLSLRTKHFLETALTHALNWPTETKARRTYGTLFLDSLSLGLSLELPEDDGYSFREIASLLHVHPFILTRFGKHPEERMGVPKSVTLAIEEILDGF